MKLLFRPKTQSYEDILATAQARRIWEEQQGTVVHALEQACGLPFLQSVIYAISGVFSDPHSGWPGQKAMALPLRIPYKDSKGDAQQEYRSDTNYIALVSHELAHHLLIEHGIVAPKGPRHDFEAHQQIYPFLLEAWALTYGAERAKILAREDEKYAEDFHIQALRWAQKLGKAKRQEVTARLIKHKRLPKWATQH